LTDLGFLSTGTLRKNIQQLNLDDVASVAERCSLWAVGFADDLV